MPFPYEDLVLGLVVNADTYDPEEVTLPPPLAGTSTTRDQGSHAASSSSSCSSSSSSADTPSPPDHQPFNCLHLAHFNYRLTPITVYPTWATERRSCHILEIEEIQSWWRSNCLVANLPKDMMVEEKLRCDPFKEHDAHKMATDVQAEYHGQLCRLQAYGLNFIPVAVDGDGSCLVHSISTALVGSQLYYDALRYGIYKELRDHRDYYLQAGKLSPEFKARFRTRLAQDQEMAQGQGMTDRAQAASDALEALSTVADDYGGALYTMQEFDTALERARPSEGQKLSQDRYLEEVHISAVANLLRRPVWMIAADGWRIFLPLRHDPEDVRQQGSGDYPSPLLLAHCFNHYVPLCLCEAQGYWEWVGRTFGEDETLLSGIRLYAQVMEFEEERRAIPEWAEDVFYYIIRSGWEALSERLDGFEISEDDKLDFLERYGKPQALSEVGQWAFEDMEAVEMKATFRNDAVLVEVYKSCGFKMTPLVETEEFIKLSLHPHLLDIRRIQLIIFALYALRNVQALPFMDDKTAPAGCVPIQGRQDINFGKVCNGVVHETIDWGIAHLYCHPLGWKFTGDAPPVASSPVDFLQREKVRLKRKFQRLTSLDFDEESRKDIHEQQSKRRSEDVRSQLPTCLMAINKVMWSRPCYPGRGTFHHSQVTLRSYPVASTAGAQQEGGGVADTPFPDIPLDTTEERRSLLINLATVYGLPLDERFEHAAMSVCLPETHTRVRTRNKFFEWITGSAEQGLANIVREHEVSPIYQSNVVTKVVLHPLAEARPLPPFHLFSMASNPPRLGPAAFPRPPSIPSLDTSIRGLYDVAVAAAASQVTSAGATTLSGAPRRRPRDQPCSSPGSGNTSTTSLTPHAMVEEAIIPPTEGPAVAKAPAPLPLPLPVFPPAASFSFPPSA